MPGTLPQPILDLLQKAEDDLDAGRSADARVKDAQAALNAAHDKLDQETALATAAHLAGNQSAVAVLEAIKKEFGIVAT